MSLLSKARFESLGRGTVPAYIVEGSARESAWLNERMYCFSQFDEEKQYDIFLSHSYRDHVAVAGLVKYLNEQYGYEIYVDWINDPELDRKNVSKKTAMIIKSRMRKCKCLFYVTSDYAPNSKWMPWELGLMDGMKSKVVICPLVQNNQVGDDYKGQEYLGIYPYITENKIKGTCKDALWVRDDVNVVKFDTWVG